MKICCCIILVTGLVSSKPYIQGQSPENPPNSAGNSSTTSGPQLNAAYPDAPSPHPVSPPAYQGRPSDTYLYNVGAFCGMGASSSPASTTPTFGCGAGLTIIPLPIFFEVGVMAPQANRSRITGYISLDGSIPLAPSSSKYLPLTIVGYSRLFETGHALDYGLALALPRPGKVKDNGKSLRIELRDYYTFASPAQHNIMLRVGWMTFEAD